MPEFVFSAGVGGSVKEGPVAGEKRARTQEMMDVGGLDSDVPPPPLPPISMSFKDKVSGDFGMAEDLLEIGDDDFIIRQGAIPSIQFSDKVKSGLYRPWRNAVILKLMGRSLSYTFLRTRLLQKWDLKGPMSKIDLENNYFIAKFLLAEDMRYVLSGGPWQIAGQYVVTQKWKPGFNAKEEKVTHMTAWVRINGLNVEYFRFDVMEKIGNLLGTTVKVDAHTMSQARGRFARVCVELDLAKPLTPFIEVEGRSYGVVYEAIQLVCFECGCYGHGRDSCPVISQAKTQESNLGPAENMEVNASDKSGDLNVKTPVTKDAEIPAKMHGQWMLMKPRSFNKKKGESGSGKVFEFCQSNSNEAGSKGADIFSGSRYNVLFEEDSGKDAIEGFTSVSFRGNVKSAIPSSYSLTSKGKTYGKQSPRPRESSPWVFKKPLKDITNVSLSKVGGVEVKGGPNLRKSWKNKVGAKPVNAQGFDTVGLQISGSEVQNDVRGVFSFNVAGSPFNDSSLGKAGLVNGHDPPDVSQMMLHEAESFGVSVASDDMDQRAMVQHDLDQHGDVIDSGASDCGLSTGMTCEHDISALEAELLHI